MYMRPSVLLLAPATLLMFAAPATAEEFEGPFVGAAAGYGRDEVGPQLNDGNVLPDELTRDAAYFQLFAGYDNAIAPKVRVGVEAAFGLGADDELRLSDAAGLLTLDPEYTFEFTGRVGYLVSDKALIYARGGYQNSHIEVNLTEVGGLTVRDKGDADGWLAGGGLEYSFGDELRGRVEYRYSDLGHGGPSWDRHQILAGVLWNF